MCRHRSVVLIKINPLHYGDLVLSSSLACLSLWLLNEKVWNCWRGFNELYGSYYIILMAKNAWLHCLSIFLPSMFLPCTDSSQPGWFHDEIYMHVLGLWYANKAGAIKQVQQQIGRLFHHVPIHITNYKICNILRLNTQIYLHVFCL